MILREKINEHLFECNQNREKQLVALSCQLTLVVDVEKENAIVKNELQEHQIKEKKINKLSDDAMTSLKGEIVSL
jgi:hypothetical protein